MAGGTASTIRPYANKEVGVGVAVGVGLPVIIIIITAVIILLLLLAFFYYRSRQKQKESEDRGAYIPLPKEDSGTAPISTPSSKLPYPPSVTLAHPPTPVMTFTMATQLSDTSKSGSRYPFMPEHKSPEGRPREERRPPRLRTKRRGNHKHGNGRHVVLTSVETSPEISDHSSDGKGAGPVHTGGIRPMMYAVPAEKATSQATPSEPGVAVQLPEIYFVLIYNESTESLIVKIERVVSLPLRDDGAPVDAYVRLFVIPKLAEFSQRRTTKTRTQRRDSAPVFEEDIRYEGMSAEELINSTLHVEVMDYRAYGKHVVLGQATLPLAQVAFENGEASMKLLLPAPETRECLGTVLLSLCYSPDTKKLSVIILRAKDLNKGNSKETDAQAKLWISMAGEKFLGKLKTKKKPQSCSPIFNEALTCTVDPNKLSSVAVNVAMMNECKASANRTLGQVTLCSQSTGEEFRHWNDVMATPGKHISEWHELR